MAQCKTNFESQNSYFVAKETFKDLVYLEDNFTNVDIRSHQFYLNIHNPPISAQSIYEYCVISLSLILSIK